MVRTYFRKTQRADISESDIRKAIRDVIKKKKSIRIAAADYNIKAATLQHRIEKYKRLNGEVLNDSGSDSAYEEVVERTYQSKYTSHQIFTSKEEGLLEEYLIKCSRMQYGLTYRQARVFAFEYALKQPNCEIPESWKSNKMAGLFWIQTFMKRHPKLSLRRPENTSLGRATAFNKHNVTEFFANYLNVMDNYRFTPDRIVNVDETGITTVLDTPKVIAESGKKQVGQAVSAERGQLVTFCGIITAIGTSIPPVYIFPRVRYKDHFLNGAPVGSLGLSSKSGWMTGLLFCEVVKHIQKHTNSSREHPILILLDNHESHCNLETILFARENGIVLLSFPPHTSHKLQPLDISVYSSFKAHLKTAFNDWMVMNAGKTISIYDIPALSNKAYLNSFTPKNILRGFGKPGIWPINQLAFADEDFLSSYVTDRDISENMTENDSVSNVESIILETNGEGSFPSISGLEILPKGAPSTSGFNIITPEEVRPFPKSKPRTTKVMRKKGKSRIYTSTPEKNRIVEIENSKKLKLVARDLKLGKRVKEKQLVKHKSGKQVNAKQSSSESDSESYDEPELSDSIDDYSEEEIPWLTESDQLNKGDFVLVKFCSKKTKIHYVGRIEEILEEGMEIKFLRKQSSKFVFPQVDDISLVTREDVVLKLPAALSTGTTARQASSLFYFAVDFDSLNLLIK